MAMTYQKPKNMKYTDMCIYIDDTMNSWDPIKNPLTRDQEDNIYKYIYHLYYNIACRKRWFIKFEQYDDYALWCAGKAFMRLLDKRQFLNVTDSDYLTPIKSILNYIKATAYGWKEKWKVESFQIILDQEYIPTFDPVVLKQNLADCFESSNKQATIDSIYNDINNIPYMLHEIINSLPYRNDKIVSKNLYISCLLLFINNLDKTSSLKNIQKFYYKLDSTPGLWHLDSKYSDTVEYILNALKCKLKENMQESAALSYISESDLDNMLWSNMAEYSTTVGDVDD